MRTDTGPVFRLRDYAPADYLVTHVALRFRLDPLATSVHATLSVTRRAGVRPDQPLRFDGDGLTLKRLLVNGAGVEAARFDASADALTIRALPAADAFTLEIETVVSPDSNKALSGLYRSNGVYCTQCEAEGFRRITYFPDRPDVLATYQVRIEAPVASCPLLLSNGNPGEIGKLDDGWHYAVWNDPWPKPSYLFALVAGDLGAARDSFITRSGRSVALNIFVEHGKEDRAAYAMDALKRSMRWDEERFGREYDLDVFNIVAVSDFNMGAMENKGLNIFNDKYVLANPETATDADYAAIEAIIAHEYFHNWTGNRITCRDWFQLCLKEGLTVYRDHEFSADQRSRAVKRIAEVRTLRAAQFPEDAGPLAHPVRPRSYREINNFYTATVYEKGSEVIRMLCTVIGQTAFDAGLQLYFDRHDGQACTIEDFLQCFAETSGKDLNQFSQWYHQAGTPHLAVSYAHNKSHKTFTIEIEQSLAPTPGETRKRLMHIPVSVALLGKDGNDLDIDAPPGGYHNGVLHVTKRRQTFVFRGVNARPTVSLLRAFSAPVTAAVEQSLADRLFLAEHDSDLFCRWEAVVGLATSELVSAMRAIRSRRMARYSAELTGLFGKIGTDQSLEPAFRALALTLPGEADLARDIGENIDPVAIRTARDQLLRAIGAHCHADFAAMIESLGTSEPFSPDAASAGKRALANVLMEYITVGQDDPALAAERFSTATNMTDQLAAMTVLAHRFTDSQESAEVSAVFQQRFGDNPLAMDKWLAVQATIGGSGALANVQALTGHVSFSIDNPNRVRALIGSFANGNPTGFHRTDGLAYGWFADQLVNIDSKNPQLAARLLTAMRSWRALEPKRRELARSALARIVATKAISTDLREIAERTIS
jgi:aminopeptidase N